MLNYGSLITSAFPNSICASPATPIGCQLCGGGGGSSLAYGAATKKDMQLEKCTHCGLIVCFRCLNENQEASSIAAKSSRHPSMHAHQQHARHHHSRDNLNEPMLSGSGGGGAANVCAKSQDHYNLVKKEFKQIYNYSKDIVERLHYLNRTIKLDESTLTELNMIRHRVTSRAIELIKQINEERDELVERIDAIKQSRECIVNEKKEYLCLATQNKDELRKVIRRYKDYKAEENCSLKDLLDFYHQVKAISKSLDESNSKNVIDQEPLQVKFEERTNSSHAGLVGQLLVAKQHQQHMSLGSDAAWHLSRSNNALNAAAAAETRNMPHNHNHNHHISSNKDATTNGIGSSHHHHLHEHSNGGGGGGGGGDAPLNGDENGSATKQSTCRSSKSSSQAKTNGAPLAKKGVVSQTSNSSNGSSSSRPSTITAATRHQATTSSTSHTTKEMMRSVSLNDLIGSDAIKAEPTTKKKKKSSTQQAQPQQPQQQQQQQSSSAFAPKPTAGAAATSGKLQQQQQRKREFQSTTNLSSASTNGLIEPIKSEKSLTHLPPLNRTVGVGAAAATGSSSSATVLATTTTTTTTTAAGAAAMPATQPPRQLNGNSSTINNNNNTNGLPSILKASKAANNPNLPPPPPPTLQLSPTLTTSIPPLAPTNNNNNNNNNNINNLKDNDRVDNGVDDNDDDDDKQGPKQRLEIDITPSHLNFANNRLLIASAQGKIRVIDLFSYKIQKDELKNMLINGICMSRDGACAVNGDADTGGGGGGGGAATNSNEGGVDNEHDNDVLYTVANGVMAKHEDALNLSNSIVVVTKSELKVLRKDEQNAHNDDYAFASPTGLCLDVYDNIYICDTGNNRVKVLDKSFSLINLIETASSSTDALNEPRSVATCDHTLFVCDSGNHRLVAYEIMSAGVELKYKRSYGLGFGHEPGMMSYPLECCVDAYGTLYVRDQLLLNGGTWTRNRVQLFAVESGHYLQCIDVSGSSSPKRSLQVASTNAHNNNNTSSELVYSMAVTDSGDVCVAKMTTSLAPATVTQQHDDHHHHHHHQQQNSSNKYFIDIY